MVSVTIDRRDGLNSAAAIKGPCRVATTANITLTGLQTVDGVALAEGDRVLVKDQTDARDNGIRIASTGNWERSADFRNSRDIVTGTQVYITHGTVSAERWYGVTAANPISVGTTNMTFAVSDNLAAIDAVAAEVDAIAAAFPAITANTMLVDNAAGDARETKTFAEVRARLGDFDTEAAFEAATISAVLTNVVTRGYYAAGDGGGHRKLRISTPSPVEAWHNQSADGAWWEISEPEYDLRYFGVSPTKTAAENSTFIQNAVDAASANMRKLHVRGGPIDCAGGVYLRSNLTMEWAPGAWTNQTDFSSVGAFFTNVSTVQAERAVSDIILINPLIDLSALTYEVTDTVHSSNVVGFARDAQRILITGGILKGCTPNFNAVGGPGGKAIGLDGGVKNFTMIGTRLESCYYGAWVRGSEQPFSEPLDGLEQTQGNKFIACHFEDLSIPIAIQGRDTTEDPDFRAQDISVQFIANTYHNCGFAPDWPASSTNRYKGGLINLGEAQNFLIDGFTGWNDDDYVTQKGGWPTTGTVVGEGLSGAPCHIINGWGAAGTIRNIQAQGPIESFWHCGRAFAAGDDAAPTKKVNVDYLLIDNIRHIGAAVNVFEQCDYDPVSASSDIRAVMDNIFPYGLSGGVIDANAASLVDVKIKVLSTSGTPLYGTPSFIYNTAGNTLASGTSSWEESARVSKPQSYPIKTVANGATISFPASKMEGLIAFSCSASVAQGILKYRCVATATQSSLFGGAIANVAVTQGANPAGAVNMLTFSFDDSGNIWVNNQRGASLDITFNQLV